MLVAPKLEQRFTLDPTSKFFLYQVIVYLPPTETWYWFQSQTVVQDPVYSHDKREYLAND